MNFKMVIFGFVVAFLLRLIEGLFNLKDYTLLLPLLITLVGYELMRRYNKKNK